MSYLNGARSGVRPWFALSRHGVLTAVCRPGGSPAGPWRQRLSTHRACSYDCARRSIDALVSRHNLEIARPGLVIGSPTEPPCVPELLLSLLKHSLARTQCPCPRQRHTSLLMRHVSRSRLCKPHPTVHGSVHAAPATQGEPRATPPSSASYLNAKAPTTDRPAQPTSYVPRLRHAGTRGRASRWGEPPNVREEGSVPPIRAASHRPRSPRRRACRYARLRFLWPLALGDGHGAPRLRRPSSSCSIALASAPDPDMAPSW